MTYIFRKWLKYLRNGYIMWEMKLDLPDEGGSASQVPQAWVQLAG